MVYEKGGHFMPHQDSAVEGLVATLLVTLPSDHTGGALVVRDDITGKEMVFDFAEHSADKSSVQWAAFYPDCEHEIKVVTGGRCVVYAFRVLASMRYAEYDTRKGYEYPFEETFVMSADRTTLDSLDGLADQTDGTMGFILRHEYGLGSLKPELLKGMDRVLYDYFTDKAHKPPRLYNVVTHDCGESYGEEDSKVECDVFVLAPGELEFHAGMNHTGAPPPPPPADKYVRFVRGAWYQQGTKLAYKHQLGASYTGNEAMPEEYKHVYLQGALVVSKEDLK